jgi:DnaK suppressor protein
MDLIGPSMVEIDSSSEKWQMRCLPGHIDNSIDNFVSVDCNVRQDRKYQPTDKEPFMNERQREYFREKLMRWREDVINGAKGPLQPLRDEQSQSDVIDRASSETDRELELRARERQRKLISKIDAALARLDDGTYGYCEETGEPISLRRLEARPIATLSVEAQERHERQEKLHRADD